MRAYRENRIKFFDNLVQKIPFVITQQMSQIIMRTCIGKLNFEEASKKRGFINS